MVLEAKAADVVVVVGSLFGGFRRYATALKEPRSLCKVRLDYVDEF